ncbi:ATP-grasp domain-containing protein [Actinotalea ferrariae]|uniref:acetyl/propionyl/methylcrotonyl-CoA carboxylase subunit alpha n=1 Tax=Actinotalea ferrariae TaxID=1386098 RepID=UPI001C8C9F97|nr:biotin carboxylase N-terminal domain-containing protein [Actinotalea ferrariae]MBX9245210.1 ATP-grasp domain-containing protein [Actinotalea ferrariae]
MFSTVLVANRGEIACRVIRTLRALGVRSVAVWTDDDRGARHVLEADDAVRLPGAGSRGYLDVDAVVAAAVAAGAEAVHPGYGFLSESPDLARACAAAGVVFVGPRPEALELMGDKIRAKAHVARAGVPVVPGTDEPGLTDDELVAAAGRVGFPVLVKPSAGGGGQGMQVVERPDELPAALRTARRVASAGFGDDALLLERYLRAPRHIEVQVLADTHGAVIHLGERECSLQRRHQKVVEEAPSPLVDDAMRERIGALACDVARSVGYVGVGTVELLVPGDAPDDAFFIEMNTRLQVEHPVTELVTGLDLVELQLRVAAGEPLPLAQDDVVLRGHAVEARVYAEDPARGFLPTTGTVLGLEEPTGEGVRVDGALLPGLVVGPAFDPMLAKVVAWGHDRGEALTRLDAALAGMTVLGVRTNVGFLRDVLADPDVRAGRLETGLLARVERRPGGSATGEPALVAAALLAVADRHGPAGGRSGEAGDDRAGRAWRRDGWRLGGPAPARLDVTADGPDADVVEVTVLGGADDATVTVGGGGPRRARLTRLGDLAVALELDDRRHRVPVAVDGATTWVGTDRGAVALTVTGAAARAARRLVPRTRAGAAARPEVRSPMPGTVVAVDVATGDHVTAGQTLLTVEAMKMEHRLLATTDGTVTLTVRPADRVTLDQVVATISAPPADPARPHEGIPA